MSIAVIIPCYKVGEAVFSLIQQIGPEVTHIIVVDDACPQKTGERVKERIHDPRVEVIIHDKNLGVGGAVITGYQHALQIGSTLAVKVDGDGQMDPESIPDLITPILMGLCDYTKGNRFFDIEFLQGMPKGRLFGNAMLSLLNKITSGYWNLMDPTNGFTAIETRVLALLPLHKMEQRYFFEMDMLYHLGIIRAVVGDIPIPARYGDEVSNLDIRLVLRQFPAKLLTRFFKRVFYNYFLRDFNAGTLMMILSFPLLTFSIFYGGIEWFQHVSSGIAAAPGVVMLAALPFLLGAHLLISAINWDINNTPKTPLHKFLRARGGKYAQRS